ncbi:glycosyltransferase family 4 protein [Piscibacillus halophilus]|uniref:UDP-GlcNAc:undecaprenyl-phosphate GlcNAc-1-phosphate transferase n=1 Tax=Piscibacillus halophilus TaxID=571933 RepID=A0A1H9MU93_9BACI|nr:MraY family glycosyltransferase [Piscibacillus halophilus]SER27238.1 UDP-GlcNAc:undecaprenyl-phosphate GlcNAc-1-phosphate transferase [Piscibacillus halophilus]
MNFVLLTIACVTAFIIAVATTPIVRVIAIKFNIVDCPDERKIHTMEKPYLGGVAIFISVMITYLIFWPNHQYQIAIISGAFVMLLTGLLDDKYSLKPVVKLAGQGLAALIIISSDLLIDKINIPFFGDIELGNLSVVVTIFWILAVSNAINLIDGLDGLAAGVASIALLSITIMAVIDGNWIVALLCTMILGANLGFLVFNFYPAKIYMGDSGSLFLGYMVAVISMLGLFKNVALFSFIIPFIVLAVPIVDTIFAIIRRMRNGESIMNADRKHFHYQLLDAGLSHKGAVILIYVFSGMFGLLAVFFSYSTVGASIISIFLVLLLIHIIAEIVGLVMGGKQPVLNFLKKFVKAKPKKSPKDLG